MAVYVNFFASTICPCLIRWPIPFPISLDIAATEFTDFRYLCKVRPLSNAALPTSNRYVWVMCSRWRIESLKKNGNGLNRHISEAATHFASFEPFQATEKMIVAALGLSSIAYFGALHTLATLFPRIASPSHHASKQRAAAGKKLCHCKKCRRKRAFSLLYLSLSLSLSRNHP